MREAVARITVLVGAPVVDDHGRLRNALLVADPDGIRVAYAKQHLWHDEQRVFTPGDSPGAVTVDGWRLGLGICYDLSFPEHARAAALTGAHGYLVAGAFATGTEYRAPVYLAARSLENTSSPLSPIRSVAHPTGRAPAAAPSGPPAAPASPPVRAAGPACSGPTWTRRH